LTDSFLPTLDTLTKGYQKGVEDLIATGSYDTKDDFTVVLQPFMKLMKPPLKVRDEKINKNKTFSSHQELFKFSISSLMELQITPCSLQIVSISALLVIK
jgi:hypothetical protein